MRILYVRKGAKFTITDPKYIPAGMEDCFRLGDVCEYIGNYMFICQAASARRRRLIDTWVADKDSEVELIGRKFSSLRPGTWFQFDSNPTDIYQRNADKSCSFVRDGKVDGSKYTYAHEWDDNHVVTIVREVYRRHNRPHRRKNVHKIA